MICPYTGILHSNKEEYNTEICYNTDELWKTLGQTENHI